MKKGLLSQKGFSLAELMVAAGLMGLVGLGIIQGMKLLGFQKKAANSVEAASSSLSGNLTLMQMASGGVSWKQFDFTRSFYRGDDLTLFNKVGWDAGAIAGVSDRTDLKTSIDDKKFGLQEFYRDSFTIMFEKQGNNGLFFSRCVKKNQYFKSFEPDEALALPRSPFLVKRDEQLQVYCCPRNSSTVCGGGHVKDTNSVWRPVTFYLKNGVYRQLPSPQDRKRLLGAGFMMLFNRQTNPDGFFSYVFSIADQCYKYGDKGVCNRNGKIHFKTLNGNVKADGVHDSGFMVIQ